MGTSLGDWDEGRGHPGQLLTPPDLYRALVPKSPWHDPRVRDIDVQDAVKTISASAGGPYDLPTVSGVPLVLGGAPGGTWSVNLWRVG